MLHWMFFGCNKYALWKDYKPFNYYGSNDAKEVIIATNPTRDGETTALYLAKLLAKKNINTSRIANGLPIGSNIDYADELTLLKSLEGRKKI